MSTGFHIAAIYETAQAARAARDALCAAGVPAGNVLVLGGASDRSAETQKGLWANLKNMLVPDQHAHAYAEGISRGHPMVIADVPEADMAAATTALKSAAPIDIETRAEEWTEAGWSGVHEGQDYWLDAQADRDAASSEGITAGGIISGDYGSVGAARGGRADTNILRGMPRAGSAPEEGRLVNDDAEVRVYEVAPAAKA